MGWWYCKKRLHHNLCTCLCTAAAGRVINIYNYKYLPISLVLHKMPNLNFRKESTLFFGYVFLWRNTEFDCTHSCSFSVSWWAMKYIFSYLLPDTGPSTYQIWESTSKGKTNGTQADHTSNRWISLGLHLGAATMFACITRHTALWSRSTGSLIIWVNQPPTEFSGHRTHAINLRKGRPLSTWPAQMCKRLHFCVGTTVMCLNIYCYSFNSLPEDYYSASR